MKVATILPQDYLEATRDDDYFLCLAHLLEAPQMEKYTEFVKDKVAQGAYVIMDNGLIEGDPRPIQELVAKAMYYGVSELILPDVFRNSIETVKAVDDAIKYIRSIQCDIKLMAVPQGETLDEWVACATILASYPEVTCLGVPKVLVDIVGRDGRAAALFRIKDISACQKKEIHLLGCWRTPLEVSIISKLNRQGDIPPVRGVDSAIPYVYARAGLRLNEDDRPDSNAIDFISGDIGDDKKALLAMNILMWHDSVNMGKDKNIWFI